MQFLKLGAERVNIPAIVFKDKKAPLTAIYVKHSNHIIYKLPSYTSINPDVHLL